MHFEFVNMAPNTSRIVRNSRNRVWTWKIPLDNASNMPHLDIRLYLKRNACCCDGYTAFYEANGEIRERVVCESATWFQPLHGKGELFSWREGGHDFEIWYNNVRVHTEEVHLFVDGVEWETKRLFDDFWKSFAFGCFGWALVMLSFSGGCLAIGAIMYFVESGLKITWLPILLVVCFVISLILAFVQCFAGVALLIRRPGRQNVQNSSGFSSSGHNVLVEHDELQHNRVNAMMDTA